MKYNHKALEEFARCIFDSGILDDLDLYPRSLQIARMRLAQDKTLPEIAKQFELSPRRIDGIYNRFIGSLPSLLSEMKKKRKVQEKELSEKSNYVQTVKGMLSRADSFVDLLNQLQEIEKNPERLSVYAKSVKDIPGISVRLLNCLLYHDMNTIADVMNNSKKDFMRMQNFGTRSLSELEEYLKTIGLILS